MIIHHIEENTKEVIEALENSSQRIYAVFSNNQMKAYADKCQPLTSSSEGARICIDNDII